MLFIWPVVAIFATNTLLFIYCNTLGKRDNSWIDPMWGILFVISNAVVLLLRAFNGKDEVNGITPRMYMISIPVFIWGLRLGIYLFIRHKREDYRYKEMREDWEKQGTCVYFTKAYMYIYFG